MGTFGGDAEGYRHTPPHVFLPRSTVNIRHWKMLLTFTLLLAASGVGAVNSGVSGWTSRKKAGSNKKSTWAAEPVEKTDIDMFSTHRIRTLKLRKKPSLWLKAKVDPVARYQLETIRNAIRIGGTEMGGLGRQPGQIQRISGFESCQYFISLQLGSPDKKQEFTCVADTGSSDLWVPASDCRASPDSGCTHQNRFSCEDSSTCHDCTQNSECEGVSNSSFAIQYGTGSCSGSIVRDDIHLLDENGDVGTTLKQQTFAQASTMAHFFSNMEFDGICGFGFASISNMGVTPFYQEASNIFGESKEDKNRFSMCLGPDSGELYLGGSNEDHYHKDTMAWLPVEEPGYWQVKMADVTIDGKSIIDDLDETKSEAKKAIVDSGTSMIVGPAGVMEAIAEKLGREGYNVSQFGDVKCSARKLENADLLFKMKSANNEGNVEVRDFKLKPSDYILEFEEGCFIGIEESSDMPFWILGDTFMQKFYVSFDFTEGAEKVGLAEKKDGVKCS